VQYKQYGVVIEFTPVADGNGNVESGIVVEVSEPDPRNSNQGYVAFTTNRAETQVALKEGEPLVIAGLLRQKVDKSGDGLPALGRIPALGYLFGSREARTEQTELFLIVSPRVVTPDSALNRTGLDKASRMEQSAVQQRDEGLPPAPLPPTRQPEEAGTPPAAEP
jgi:pilus assembly protein CpaC